MAANSNKAAALKGTRQPSKAGSWYTDDAKELAAQLDGWLGAVDRTISEPIARAVVAPHAGYSYSGPSAAWAYQYLDPGRVRRIFLLGPSHYAYLTTCALTSAAHYGTPLGDIAVDAQVVGELQATRLFDTMARDVDEEEHSLELHLPYIHRAMRSAAAGYTLVPILVGDVPRHAQEQYGRVLAPYLADQQNFFVISSDFCHWGKRFRFQPVPPDPAATPLHRHIEALDRRAIATIESLRVADFQAYLKETKNTICGRNPIQLLMHTAAQCTAATFALRFVHYAQSSQCESMADSSVSYAAGVLYDSQPAPAAAASSSSSSSSSSTAPAAAAST